MREGKFFKEGRGGEGGGGTEEREREGGVEGEVEGEVERERGRDKEKGRERVRERVIENGGGKERVSCFTTQPYLCILKVLHKG